MIRFYFGGFLPRHVQAGLCFTLNSKNGMEDVVISKEGLELWRRAREKNADWIGNAIPIETRHQSEFPVLLNGCRLEFHSIRDPSSHYPYFRLAWELRAPDRNLLATIFPDCYYVGLQTDYLSGIYQMSENCFLVQYCESILIVNTYCTLAQWSPKNDYLLLNRDLLRTWMLIANRLELDKAIAHKIALLC